MGKSYRQSYFSNSPLKGSARQPAGFTLIELLVVIGLIGVMASVLIVIIDPLKQLQRARDTRRKSDIAQIQQALEMYRSDNNGYPGSVTCNSSLTSPSGNTIYLRNVPCDPKNSSPFTYIYTPDQSSNPPIAYTITACLENTSDPTGTVDNTICPGGLKYTQNNP